MNKPVITTMASLSLMALALAGCGAATATPDAPAASTATSTDADQAAPEYGGAAFDAQITNNSLAVSPDEKTAVVSDSRENAILVYDLAAGGLLKKIDGFVTPRNIVFIKEGSQFVVSDSTVGTLRFYGTEDQALMDEIVVGPGAFGTAVSPDGKTMYVNNQAHSSVTVIDLEARKPTDVITGFSRPRQGIKVSPDGKRVYVTNFEGDKVTVVDAESKKILRELGGFSKIRGISVAADGNTLYAANSGRNSISVVDSRNGKITNEIEVGLEPYGAALSPDGTLLLASNKSDNTIDVIDVAQHTIVKTLEGFKEPRQAIVFGRGEDRAYVLNRDLSVARVQLEDLAVLDTIRE